MNYLLNRGTHWERGRELCGFDSGFRLIIVCETKHPFLRLRSPSGPHHHFGRSPIVRRGDDSGTGLGDHRLGPRPASSRAGWSGDGRRSATLLSVGCADFVDGFLFCRFHGFIEVILPVLHTGPVSTPSSSLTAGCDTARQTHLAHLSKRRSLEPRVSVQSTQICFFEMQRTQHVCQVPSANRCTRLKLRDESTLDICYCRRTRPSRGVGRWTTRCSCSQQQLESSLMQTPSFVVIILFFYVYSEVLYFWKGHTVYFALRSRFAHGSLCRLKVAVNM